MVGRIPVMDVMPLVDLGRLPAKATAGEALPVRASVFREGHDRLGAEVVLVAPDGSTRPPVRMVPDGDAPDRYVAWVTPDAEGAWTFEVHAWSDPLATWEHDAGLKIPAGVDVELMFTAGGLLLDRVAADPALDAREAEVVRGAASAARDPSPPGGGPAGRPAVPRAGDAADRPPAARAGHGRGPLPAVRRPAAGAVQRAGTSCSRGRRARRTTRRPARSSAARSAPPPSGSTPWPRWASTWSTCRRSTRSARSTARAPTTPSTPAPHDPGSPWAIGSKDGGHDAIHPDLGTLDDFDAFVAKAPSARARGGPRPGPAVRARPPVGDQPPRVVHHPGRRHHRLRREPAEEVPGHLPAELRQRPPGHLPGGPPGRPALDEARRADLPGRQPPHQAGRLLGVAAARGAPDRPRRAVPGRGVHPAGDDADPRRDRLPPELHLLHLAHGEVGDRGVPPRGVVARPTT